MVREALELLYEGVCTVEVFAPVADDYGVTKHTNEILFSDLPCRLSHSKVAPANQTETGATVDSDYTLFLSPAVVIPVGSVITVTQYGTTYKTVCSSVRAVYASHQEIAVTIEQRWA